ncbi:dehydrogenase [Nitrospira sp. MA-1]|nr:dehydrogenase [Nitrospira sp. MA-1]
MIIRARAPLRLGLAGGGTDVSPYCDLYGGCVLNATIDRYAYAVLEVLTGNKVQFCSADRQHFSEYQLGETIPYNGCVDLHRAVYLCMVEQFNEGRPLPVKVTTYCDAPVGSGLGSSSTLVVAMLKAFVELLNVPIDDYALAHLAFKVERVDCGLQGGRQDQYAATFGGVNFIEFYADDRVIVNPLRIKNWIICELEASLVLFFTGVSRSSEKIIADQRTNVEAGTVLALSAMHAMKREACAMKECLLKGDFTGLVESMREGWDSKKRSAKSVSNAHLDEIYEAAIKAGALAGKVSGAGGGGFMMFFVAPEKRMDVIFALKKFSGQVSNCHFTKYGMQGWKID